MAIRISGMNSGLDTESIVSALVSSYSTKKDKYVKAQTKLSWTQDAWKGINTKVYSLFSKLDTMRYSSGYSLKKTTVSDPTKATVTASGSAFNGSQKLNVLSTAQSGYLTGAKLDKDTSGSTTMAELGFTGSDGKIEISKGDGSKASITVSSNMTVNDFVSKLKDNGLNASFDASNKRIYVNSKATGADADFNLTGSNVNGVRALNALGLNIQNDTTKAITSAYSGLYDTDPDAVKAKLSDMVSAYRDAQTAYNTASAQNGNLIAAYSYSVAYSSLQSDTAALKAKGVSDNDIDKLGTIVKQSDSVRNTAVMSDDDTLYKYQKTDDNGDKIYSYDDGNGNTSYVKAVTTYTDDSGASTWKLNSDGKMVDPTSGIEFSATGAADEDGNAKYAYTDENGETTEITIKATTTYYSATPVTDTTTDDDGVETETTSYSTGDVAGDISTLVDRFNAIKATVQGNDEDSTEASDLINSFGSNFVAVDGYENTADTVLADTDAYSRASIVDAVHSAYASGGAGAVEDLTNSYGEVIANNKSTMNDSSDIMADNTVVSVLAGLTEGTDEYNNALGDLLDKINAAHAIEEADLSASEGASKIAGKDAVIKLNGAEYTSSNGSFNINGLTINALAETGDGDENAININTTNDVQGIYDKIKDFLEEYNEVINEITKLYNADSARGYEPLTDDEKEAMTDSQVEKWETKIKDSLLRRDTTLGGILNTMTSSMSSVYEINGKKYSLASFGISTLGILNSAKNEQNAYHIDGDADDSTTSTKTDKLLAAINDDPDSVVEFLKKLTNGLHENLNTKMRSTSLRSAYTIYNDKEMASEYSDYTSTIKKWEKKVADMEDSYYKKFTAMEKALASLNSNSSQLAGMFG